ncbi:MAG: serine hydrolase [Calditrichaceae bacterium]
MKPMKLFTTLALILILSESVFSQNSVSSQIDSLAGQWLKPDAPGGVIAVILDGKVAHKKAYGMMNLENKLPDQINTVFNIGSLSKQFTAASLVLLEEQGKISLEDDIRKYIPEFPDYGASITIRHLLNHTSGITDYDWLTVLTGSAAEGTLTENSIFDLITRQRQLNFTPGDEYYYSNSGYFLAGLIVKRVSGMTLPQFVSKNIFKPLGMNHSFIFDNPDLNQKNLATGYIAKNKHEYTEEHSFAGNIVGDGGVCTTIDDMILWDSNFSANKIGGSDFTKKMYRQGLLNNGETIDYALGLLIKKYRGLDIAEHGGFTGGFKAHYLRFPGQNLSVIILSNLGNINANKLTRQIAELYLSDQMEANEPKPVDQSNTAVKTDQPEPEFDKKVYDDYAGRYDFGGGFIMTVTHKNGQLFGQATGQPAFEFFPESENKFTLKVADAQGIFLRDENDRVSKLEWHQGGREMTASKLEPQNLTEADKMIYTGKYFSDEIQMTYPVTMEDGELYLGLPKFPEFIKMEIPAKMIHIMNDQFSIPYMMIEFKRDAENKITGFILNNEIGKVTLEFTKTE